MRIYSSEPLKYVNRRLGFPADEEPFPGGDIYEEVWLPVGDEKEADIMHLLQQNRL
ncbi:MAG: hypothetical protein GXY34_08355 [Syntrophomonadaceae bacterium]|nr:hypothetical protein [Syntrophomonadaceae bacterium]